MAVEAVPGDVSEALLRHLLARDGRVSGIEALRAVTSGASQEIWTFMACRGSVREPLVLRRARHWNADSQASSAGMAAEAALLRVAAAHGVPVPRVLSELDAEDGLGEGYVMAHVAGETAGHRILRDPALAARLPQLVHWSRAYRANGVARPVFEFALRWLADHAPRPVPTALVHGDFRNGNLVA